MYNLKNRNELIAFARDCRNAIGECRPTQNYRSADKIELEILRGESTAEDIFNEFNKCPILWRYGYSSYLNKDSQEVFYHVQKLKKKAARNWLIG